MLVHVLVLQLSVCLSVCLSFSVSFVVYLIFLLPHPVTPSDSYVSPDCSVVAAV